MKLTKIGIFINLTLMSLVLLLFISVIFFPNWKILLSLCFLIYLAQDLIMSGNFTKD